MLLMSQITSLYIVCPISIYLYFVYICLLTRGGNKKQSYKTKQQKQNSLFKLLSLSLSLLCVDTERRQPSASQKESSDQNLAVLAPSLRLELPELL